jgi:hypothetical protein
MNQLMAWRSAVRFTQQSIIITQTRGCATEWACLLWITKWRVLEMVAVWGISRY